MSRIKIFLQSMTYRIILLGLFVIVFNSPQVFSQLKLTTLYNADSTIRSEGLVDDNGLKQGNWTSYGIEGSMLQMGKYVDGKRDGIWIAYDGSGNIIMETQYENDISTGILRKYYPGRKLKEEEQKHE